MDSQEDQLVLTGMTELDLAELRQDMTEAGLGPDQFVAVERATAKPDAHYEPVTVTIVLGLAKIIVPAVAGVVSTWLINRGGSGRKRAAHVRRRNAESRPIDIKELTTGDAAAVSAKLSGINEEEVLYHHGGGH
jgi:hypothetical protein